MVLHGSLSDSKSPQISRTLLSILVVLNNAVVWMVSTRPPTTKSSSSFNNPLVTIPKATITIGIIVKFMFHRFFQFPSKVEEFIFHLLYFLFYCVVSWDSKVDNFPSFPFFVVVDYNKVWSSGREYVIRLHVKVPLEIVCVILLDRHFVVYIPFVHVVKSKFPAHLLVDHLAHPVVSSLILFLSYFAA